MEVDDFGDRRQFLIEGGYGEVDTRMGNFSLKQRTEHKGQDAVEGMDP